MLLCKPMEHFSNALPWHQDAVFHKQTLQAESPSGRFSLTEMERALLLLVFLHSTIMHNVL